MRYSAQLPADGLLLNDFVKILPNKLGAPGRHRRCRSSMLAMSRAVLTPGPSVITGASLHLARATTCSLQPLTITTASLCGAWVHGPLHAGGNAR